MKMKKFLAFAAVLVISAAIMITTTMAAESADVKVLINGEVLAGEKQPVIVDGRTLVPFRAIGEIMGCEVSWDDKTRTAFLENSSTKVAMSIDDNIIVVEKDGVQTKKQIDVAPTIIDNSTFIPARAFAESLGANIGWDGETRTVTVDYTDFIVRRTIGNEWYITPGGDFMGWGAQGRYLTFNQSAPMITGGRYGAEFVSYPIKILGDVASAACEYNCTNYVAIKNDASLVTCGYNDYGFLGIGESEEDLNKSDTPVTVMYNVADIGRKGDTVFALKSDGSLWGWGYAYNLGSSTIGECAEPIKIMDDVKRIEINIYGCAAIKKDGSLWTWNESWMDKDHKSPKKIMDNVIDVSMGLRHYGVVKQDGTLWLCGRDKEGELGPGNYYGLKEPKQVATDVKDVECNAGITAYITNDGKLVTFGNSYADGWTSGGEMYLSTEHKYILENVIAVKMGSEMGCALTSDGSLYHWGKDIVQNRSVETFTTPVKIAGGVGMPSTIIE